ncbi:MAG: SPFH domain-containing protein [Eubacterium sp.]|nr:SPFH domain-containing protein [Eubacterium sp.]
MGFIKDQFLSVVEWEEWREDMIFWKWSQREIKKGSRLILKPGQDAIFLNQGKIEGIFEQEGDYDIESQIIPLLSTLKGFKFGFNSGMRAEVLFVNTKEFLIKWGTKNQILLPSERVPGGIPVRANGTATVKVGDYTQLIDTLAGIKTEYYVDNVREIIIGQLDQLLMKWISSEGKDMFNLQANATQISEGIRTDLDMQLSRNGINVTTFAVSSFTYPPEIQEMINKVAAQSFVGDVNKYQTLTMTDAMADGKLSGGNSTMGNMAEMMMGMTMANNMMNNMGMGMNQQQPQYQQPQYQQQAQYQQPQQMQYQQMQYQQAPQQAAPAEGGAVPKFCPNCGTPTNGAKFCGNCGTKLA